MPKLGTVTSTILIPAPVILETIYTVGRTRAGKPYTALSTIITHILEKKTRAKTRRRTKKKNRRTSQKIPT
jgi:hypothetical protein